MTEKKVFVNEQNVATFICPKCERAKSVDVSPYKDAQKAVRVKAKCSCGHHYSVLLERRKYYRKSTSLPGTYMMGKGSYPMTVKDISRTGVKFNVKPPIRFKAGEELVLEFVLDDAHRSRIRQRVRVRSISGETVGAEFTVLDPSDFDYKAIGFYLFK